MHVKNSDVGFPRASHPAVPLMQKREALLKTVVTQTTTIDVGPSQSLKQNKKAHKKSEWKAVLVLGEMSIYCGRCRVGFIIPCKCERKQTKDIYIWLYRRRRSGMGYHKFLVSAKTKSTLCSCERGRSIADSLWSFSCIIFSPYLRLRTYNYCSRGLVTNPVLCEIIHSQTFYESLIPSG